MNIVFGIKTKKSNTIIVGSFLISVVFVFRLVYIFRLFFVFIFGCFCFWLVYDFQFLPQSKHVTNTVAGSSALRVCNS